MEIKTSDIVVDLIDYCGSDLSVVNAARVTMGKESRQMSDKDSKLIHYLAENRHRSPFNHSFLSFRVKAPIFVARQLVKHEYLPWNEISRRYVDTPPEFYIPNTFRMKVDDLKQGSSKEEFEYPMLKTAVEGACAYALTQYNFLLSSGVAPELARMVLPLNTMTEWIWSGTLGAFLKMLTLRLDEHAQKEARIVAQYIWMECNRLFPVATEAVLEKGYI